MTGVQTCALPISPRRPAGRAHSGPGSRLVQRRKGAKVARVALARRLAEIIAQVWKEETDFFAVLRRGGVRG